MSAPSRVSAAIILDCKDHGESDKIITFFTKERGRLTGIAKGANRSKKRFVNKLEIFSSITVTYSEGRHSNLAFISEAELHSSFINLRRNITLYNSASIIREIFLLATTEQEGESEIYYLLLWALHSLNEAKPYLGVITIFLLRLYDAIGYRPDLSGCQFCNKATELHQKYGFHHTTGGLICNNCMDKGSGRITKLSMGTIKLMESAITHPLLKLHRLQFSKQALHESLSMLHKYSRNLFQREIHSWKTISLA